MEQNQPDYEKQSLLNQIADYASRLARSESELTKKVIELNELDKELEEYRKNEIKEMDEGGNDDEKTN